MDPTWSLGGCHGLSAGVPAPEPQGAVCTRDQRNPRTRFPPQSHQPRQPWAWAFSSAPGVPRKCGFSQQGSKSNSQRSTKPRGTPRRLGHQVRKNLEPTFNPWSSEDGVVPASGWGQEWAIDTGSKNGLAGGVLASLTCWIE